MKRNIAFNWDIHWVCNYRCPYCWFHGQWEKISNKNIYPDIKRVIGAWDNIYSKYGEVKLSITGGEPFLYPKFDILISEVSKKHKIEIITNLSVDISRFLAQIRENNVTVNPSFHPSFADFSGFADRLESLRARDMVRSVTCVAWPEIIKEIPEIKRKFKERGVDLSLQAFFGEYNGIKYPEGYSEEEIAAVYPDLGKRGGKKFQAAPAVTKGKLCYAGVIYGVIQPDGTVLRCGGHEASNKFVGNLFDDGFKLWDAPVPCNSEMCPCNEWAFLLEENIKHG